MLTDLAAFALPLAEPLALGTDVVAQHGTEDEILLGSQLIERTVDNEANGIQTLRAPEIKVQVLPSCGLHKIGDAHVLQALTGKGLIALMTGEEHHLSHSFAKLVDMIHQHLQVDGAGLSASSLVRGRSGLGLLHGQKSRLKIRSMTIWTILAV